MEVVIVNDAITSEEEGKMKGWMMVDGRKGYVSERQTNGWLVGWLAQ